MTNHIIPFFVADRPASLLILKGILLKHPKIRVGIMTHAFTSRNLWRIFNSFPHNLPLLYEDPNLLKNEDLLAHSLIKISDSGVFSKNGCGIDYEELFERYNQMGTDFGVMIDVLRDAKETIKSAEKALRTYERNRKKYKFKLVAVAQGNNLDEYLECYEKLSYNFEFIAVGGLLKKRENSARYVRVRDENLLYDVLHSIKEEFKPSWLFALGCYHPSRHKRLEEIGVWGSDYKGWIFNYKLKRQLISDLNHDLLQFELINGFGKALNKMQKQIEEVEKNLSQQEKKWREAKDNLLKKSLWGKIEQLKKELNMLNKKLLIRRKYLAERNHLPLEYKDKLKSFESLIYESEQKLRFQQVRNYIEVNVYGQLR
jgi:hypothetical protein